MATDILRPTCNNFSNYYHNHHATTTTSYRKPLTRPDHTNRVAASDSMKEKVTILRRGHSLHSSSMFTVSTDVYAGSAFSVVAPSPSALPLPSFPIKKRTSPAIDDSATRGLRRLLRLE
ncbi:unnamed protein product [Lupinus luteus]|uniref:Uncharacterized protein n=1 Tax=Lupinus luteus TaxID=3873 RepID=A0AAV1XY80_LUPLU